MADLFDISGQVVLITGSSRGLGFAFAAGFAEAGAKVVINGTSSRTVDPAVEKIRQQGGLAWGYPFDVTDDNRVEQSIVRIEREVGPIDVLINNAGIQRRAPLEGLTLENWMAVIDVNLTSAFIVTRHVGQAMIERKRGTIINVSSLNAEGSRPTIANYCAAKGGLEAFTRSIATEWGKYNVRANAIAPGYFITDLTRPLADDPAFDAWVKQNVPLGRWGDPSELVGTAIFLASRASSYISGRVIAVDGGWRASL
jgi:gluconate 5-dehydrogenase